MPDHPLVSVVVIFLDAVSYLEEAIESVRTQTYPHWELLLVDDGSTDGSSDLARRYAREEPHRIRYLQHEGYVNRGKSTSRNVGITMSRGDYLAFLDADDTFLPEKLERQLALFESSPEAGMVYGPTLYWYSDARKNHVSDIGVPSGTLFTPPALLTRFLADGSIVPGICSLLSRTEIVRRAGGFDETIQHLYEDQVFIARMCLEAPVLADPGCWDRYRQHAASSSALAIRSGDYHPWRPNESRRRYLLWLDQVLRDKTIHDRALLTELERQLRPYRYPIAGGLYHLYRHVRGRLARRLRSLLMSTNG